MAVYKRYKGRKVKRGDKDFDKATWVYRFKLRGVLYSKSVPEARTRQDAELAEQAVKNAIFAGRYGFLTDNTTFKQFTDTVYIPYVEQHNKNVYSKKIFIKVLNDYFGKMLLKEITPQDCRNFIAKRKNTKTIHDRKRQPASINKEISTLSKIFNLAIEERKLEHNPMRFVKMLKESAPRERILSGEEWERFLEEIEKDRTLYFLSMIAMHTGLRKGQILAIRAEDIDFDKRILKAVPSKGRDERYIALNNTMVGVFRELTGETPKGKLFPFKDFRRRWDSAAKRAGIKDFHFHDLKHQFGTELIKRGVNPFVVQTLYAHSDMRITKGYLHPDMDLMFDAVRRLDDVQELENLQ